MQNVPLWGARLFARPTAANGLVIYSALRFFKIFFTNGSLISMCRGTASIIPFFGLIQSECEAPSRFK
jgi:hypothetical protein